jgi:hypothetical protein
MASDIGRAPSKLLLEYPALDFSKLAGERLIRSEKFLVRNTAESPTPEF